MIYQIKLEITKTIKLNGLPSNEEMDALVKKLGSDIMNHKVVPIITVTNSMEEMDNKGVGDW